MSTSELIFTTFVALGLVNFLHVGFYIAGANFYDMWQFRRAKLAAKKGNRGRKPRVSVVISAYNEELGIRRCLDSVQASTYSNFEVLVMDDGSADDTAKKIQSFMRSVRRVNYMGRNGRNGKLERRSLPDAKPRMQVKLVRQANAGKATALNRLIREHATGSLVMTLDADSVLHPEAIQRAVTYFRDPRVAGVAANVRVMGGATIIGLLQKFEHMVGYRSKKFYSMTNSEFIVGGVASTYRRKVLDRVGHYDTDTMTEDIGLSMKITALGNRRNRLIYASDVVAMTEGVQDFKGLLKQRYRWKMGSLQNLIRHRRLMGSTSSNYTRMLTFYRLPMALYSEFMLLLQPFMMAYVLYLTLTYQTSAFFMGAYMVMTLYVLWTVWPDEHANFWRKVSLSFYAPIMYFVFYLMDVIQVVSIVKCLLKPKLLLGLEKGESKWVSPKRAGGEVATF